jgi:hypothetical protein
MPYCPNCRTEFIAGTQRCGDCGRELVEQLTPRPGADAEAMRPVELCQVSDLVELDLIEAHLRAAGIPSVRRPRSVALFVPAGRAKDAQLVLAGKSIGPAADTVGLSELHRIRLACSDCEKVTGVDLLNERIPLACTCGHVFDLGEVRPVLERYSEVMRMLADTEFEVELELPTE